jgi:hypothetical protein
MKIKCQLFVRLASTPLSHRWLSGVEAISLGTLIYCGAELRSSFTSSGVNSQPKAPAFCLA